MNDIICVSEIDQKYSHMMEKCTKFDGSLPCNALFGKCATGKPVQTVASVDDSDVMFTV